MKQKLGMILVFLLLLSYITTASATEASLTLQSQAIVLIEQSTGKVLYEKNAHQKIFPASTVKILTTLIALENASPDDVITIGNEVLQVPLDASKAGHVPGDQIKLKDLVAALLLPSGNDSAFAIASYIIKKTTGTEDVSSEEANAKFAVLMNEKAKTLGANESNFINPHGYHDENNYTTAYDLAIITREALKNPIIKEIVGLSKYTFNDEGQTAFEWGNRNLLLDPKSTDYFYPYATGVKTGFTDEAGECLVASATKEGVDLIAVVMNSPVDARWVDAKTLFDYGFENYVLHTFARSGDVVEKVAVEQSTRKGPAEIEAVAAKEAMNVINKADISKIEKTVTWNKNPFVAPIEAGQVVGKVVYSIEGNALAEVELTAQSAILKQTLVEFVFSINAVPYWGAGLGVIALLMIIGAIVSKRKNSRKGYHFR